MNYIPRMDEMTVSSNFAPNMLRARTLGSDERRVLFLDTRDHIAGADRVFAEFALPEFKKHERKWKRETRHLSDPAEKYLHPSYARVIGLGWPAVRLILRSLKREPADWFYALRAITGANPVTTAMAGDVRQMSQAWINWGERRGIR
jgi:hypothetical protein